MIQFIEVINKPGPIWVSLPKMIREDRNESKAEANGPSPEITKMSFASQKSINEH